MLHYLRYLYALLVLLGCQLVLLGCPKYQVPVQAKVIQNMCIKSLDESKLVEAENYCKLALRYNPK